MKHHYLKSKAAGKDVEIDEVELKKDFDKQHWVHKVDDRADHKDLENCIELLVTFYSKRAQSVVLK